MSKTKHLVSVSNLTRNTLDEIIDDTLEIKRFGLNHFLKSRKKLPENLSAGSLFYEPSTRTRLSYETALRNLGISIAQLGGKEASSVSKGEMLKDTFTMFQGYGIDLAIMRHNLDGAAKYLSDISDIPILNAGDGSGDHPSQTMLDLVTIKERYGKIDGLKIALVGDLKNGRTVHSLIEALSKYNVEVTLVAPDVVKMQDWRIKNYENESGNKIKITNNLQEAVGKVDIVYMTRIQRERFAKGDEGDREYKEAAGIYKITKKLLDENANENLSVMHPLPRVKTDLEITPDVDDTKYNLYYEQAKNGLFTREAIIYRALTDGFEVEDKPEYNLQGNWINIGKIGGTKKGKGSFYSLDNGTLIDHIPAYEVDGVKSLLGLSKTPKVTTASGIPSKKYGEKDVIGVENIELSSEQLNKLTLIDPNITVSYINKRTVIKKGRVELPDFLKGIICCENPKCLTYKGNFEHVPTSFKVLDKGPDNPIMQCDYCGEIVQRDNLTFKK